MTEYTDPVSRYNILKGTMGKLAAAYDLYNREKDIEGLLTVLESLSTNFLLSCHKYADLEGKELTRRIGLKIMPFNRLRYLSFAYRDGVVSISELEKEITRFLEAPTMWNGPFCTGDASDTYGFVCSIVKSLSEKHKINTLVTGYASRNTQIVFFPKERGYKFVDTETEILPKLLPSVVHEQVGYELEQSRLVGPYFKERTPSTGEILGIYSNGTGKKSYKEVMPLYMRQAPRFVAFKVIDTSKRWNRGSETPEQVLSAYTKEYGYSGYFLPIEKRNNFGSMPMALVVLEK